jgi:hypothetical protein
MFEKCNCTAGTTFCEKYKISVNTRQHQFLRGDSGLSRNVEGCNLKEGPILPGRARWATKDCPDPKGSHWPKVELPVITQKPPGRSCCGGR